MKTRALFLLTLITMAITSHAQSVPLEVGQTVQGAIPMSGDGEKSIFSNLPLIEGPWTIEFLENRTLTNFSSTRFRTVALMQFSGGKLAMAAEYESKVDSTNVRWNDEPCKVEPTLFKNDYGTSMWKQKCMTVQPVTFLQNNNEGTRNALATLAKRGLTSEFNSLSFVYTRYGDINKFLMVRLHFFPSAYGLENPVVGMMNSSPWAPQNVNADPAKVKFISALRRYAEYVVVELDKAYDSGKASGPIKAFKYPEIAESDARQPKTEQAPTTFENRLGKLKELLEKGLLTKDEYEAQRKKVLETL